MKDILDLMIQLEMDVSYFYKKIARMVSLRGYTELFEYMSSHSAVHSKTIAEVSDRFCEIPLNKQKFVAFQARLKNEVLEKVAEERNMTKISEILAEAEGLMGYAYDKIAAYLETNGEIMIDAARTIRKIAAEEREHKQQVLNLGKGKI